MNLGSARSVALVGVVGTVITVEVAIGGGLPKTVIVGLPDASLYEARDRCRAAVASSGLAWPQQAVTINLSPATLPKTGSHYDLAIAAAVLAAAETVPGELLASTVLLGELGLDGKVHRVNGVLPALVAAVQAGIERAVVPATQVAEAQLVEGITVWGVGTLADVVEVLHGRPVVVSTEEAEPTTTEAQPRDLSDVVGHQEARWILEVAAAGRHHLFLHGPPGAGKTLLAERLPSILPELTTTEALQVAAVQSLAGLSVGERLPTVAPYCDPHHSASLAALVGGGARVAKPGAVSLAHMGVLFLDEAPEFSPRALDALRTPLESGEIVLSRSAGQVRYPARFQLVLAANPCPCGQHGSRSAQCTCQPQQVRRYVGRISGPIRDRIDLHHHVRPLQRSLVNVMEPGESSAEVASRVRQARDRQHHRLQGTMWRTNAEVTGVYLRTELPLPQGLDFIDKAVAQGRLSSRGVDKVLRIAWTLADLAGVDVPTAQQVRTALAMRRGEAWGAAA